MKFDVNHYRVNKHYLEQMLRSFPTKKPLEVVAMCAAATSCHLLAVTAFLIEIRGPEPEFVTKLNEHIAEMKRFGYSEIITENKEIKK
jgi:hypothetical protein